MQNTLKMVKHFCKYAYANYLTILTAIIKSHDFNDGVYYAQDIPILIMKLNIIIHINNSIVLSTNSS